MLLSDQLAAQTSFWDVVVGFVVVVVAIAMPSGIVGGFVAGLRRMLRHGKTDLKSRVDTTLGPTLVADLLPPAGKDESDRISADAPVLLKISNLTKNFGGLRVTRNVTIDVRKGTIHAIIGPNGAGKTTLFNLITGALRPNEGSVVFDGRDITNDPPWQRVKHGLGRTFQQPNIFPGITVLQNVALAHAGVVGATRRPFGVLRQEIAERAEAILQKV
jgi:ABC-type glutathione transport system ATPase component